jgi:hypothetical protein
VHLSRRGKRAGARPGSMCVMTMARGGQHGQKGGQAWAEGIGGLRRTRRGLLVLRSPPTHREDCLAAHADP